MVVISLARPHPTRENLHLRQATVGIHFTYLPAFVLLHCLFIIIISSRRKLQKERNWRKLEFAVEKCKYCWI